MVSVLTVGVFEGFGGEAEDSAISSVFEDFLAVIFGDKTGGLAVGF